MTEFPHLLASTWDNGVFVLGDGALTHELPGTPVCGLSSDLRGGALASVDGHTLFRRDTRGNWHSLARCDSPISTTFAARDRIFVGTDDARILTLSKDHTLEQIDTFASIEGRDSWLAGTAIIDGQEVGPPLGVRSLHGAQNGLLLANIHIGGIPRSVDGGSTWSPTIDVSLDAHEVRVDDRDTNLVVAATAEGLCMSHDGGNSWSLHTDGLHTPYCSAVTIAGSSVFVAASEGHFAAKGFIYRRSTKRGAETMKKAAEGLPEWLDGIVDTSCIASTSKQMALVSAQGSVYLSNDAGQRWRKEKERLAAVSSLLIISEGAS